MVFNNEIVVYQKSHEVPYKGIIKGDEQIKYIDTPYGRIGAIVCLDLEFDHFMTQAGSQNIDILVAASSDWTSMQKNHSLTNAFRAIENGVNLIKPTYPGSSIVTNYHGEILLDYYMNNYSYYLDKQFNLVSIPCKGKFTIYPYLALFIDYLYLCTFVGLTIGYSVYDYVNKWKKMLLYIFVIYNKIIIKD